MNPYETDQLLSEYLLFHYGEDGDILPYDFGPHSALHFAERCVTDLLLIAGRSEFDRALDIGCAVGRSSFELARYSQSVIGMDYSARFIEAARQIQRAGEMTFTCTEEGRRIRHCTAHIPEKLERSKVQFEVGDAQNLPEKWNGTDLVLACNLICRLREPMRFFERLPDLVRHDGIFLLCSPYTWMETYTPLENWLGSRNAEDQSAVETIREILEPDFDFLGAKDLPFLIREHARKYQWSISHGTVWRRK